MSDEPDKMDKLVAEYVTLRDFKKTKQDAMVKEISGITDILDDMEAEMMTFLTQTGQESARTKAGTFFKKTATKCSVADWDVIWKFIQDNELYNFLNRSVNKTAVEDYIELNSSVPPGVNISRETTISVNRPKTR